MPPSPAILYAGRLRSRVPATTLAPEVSWNYVVAVGAAVTLVSVALGYRARQAELASLRSRYRWSIRLALGYGGLLFANFLVAALRFAWAFRADDSVTETKAFLLGVCISAAFNFVLGFLLFGMAPTLVAFMLARRVEKREESGPPG